MTSLIAKLRALSTRRARLNRGRTTTRGAPVELMERRQLMASLGVLASMDYPRFGVDFGQATLTSGGSLQIESPVLNSQSSSGGPLNPLVPPGELDVNIVVDADGELVGGAPLVDDFVLSNGIDVLLTGEITAFNEESGATEYLFTPTGGTAEYFGPTGYFAADSMIGLYLTLDTVPIPFGTDYTSIDAKGEFGVIPPFGNPPVASLGDYVWYDVDADGIQDATEAGVPGITVKLFDASNVLVSTTTTGANGEYLFDNLTPGTYSVQFVAPGWKFTAANKGANDALDSDADKITGRTGTYTLAAGEHNPTVDAGLVGVLHGLTGTIGFWHNRNGQQMIRLLGGTTARPGTSTALGNWLAAKFPNMYGAKAGAMNLTGKTTDYIAKLFVVLKDQAGQKLEAQVMAVTFALYTTDTTLNTTTDGRNWALKHGFSLSSSPVLANTKWNLDGNGEAFAVKNTTTGKLVSSDDSLVLSDDGKLTVMQLLTQCNYFAVNGVLYANAQLIQSATSSTSATYSSATLRNQANVIFSNINEEGDIIG